METSIIKDLKKEIDKKELLISFEDEISEADISLILKSVEEKLEAEEEDFKIIRKVYNILVEVLQNLYHHTDKYSDKAVSNGEKVKSVAFYLVHGKESYEILSANYISLDNVSALKAKLDKINDLDKDGLRAYYKEVLDNGEYSVHGGGGLGMIDIARKSGNKLEYAFRDLDDKFGVYTLKIRV